LERVIQAIGQRHEILRTRFVAQEGVAQQVIDPSLTTKLAIIDWQGLPAAEQAQRLQQLTCQEAQRPFDLANEPLLRFTLLQLAEQSYGLIINLHHIVADAWSVGIFLHELAVLYPAMLQAAPAPLPELSIQYADFAHWQRQWLQGDVLEQQLAYWRQQLADAPALLALPTDRPRPPVQTFRGAAKRFSLEPELAAQLKRLSQQSGATLFMTLLAAFSTLLSRYSGQTDLVIGSLIANRHRREVEPLIGFFVNALALRIGLQDNPTFIELLAKVRQIALGAYAHQDLPFEKLVEELRPERSLSQSPLFQVMFDWQTLPPGQTLQLPGLTLTPLDLRPATAKFDLTLAMSESASGIGGEWRYNLDLFDEATIDRMMAHFQTLLRAIVANPHQPVAQMALLSAAEQRQLLIDWNQTQKTFRPAHCLQELFESQVARTPEAVAAVCETERLTYEALNQRANQLAHYLSTLGVGPESKIGLYAERSLDLLVGLWGILKAGGAYVPLDPAYSQQRLAFVLEDAGVAVLLTQRHLVEQLPQPSRRACVCLDTDEPLIARQPRSNPAQRTRSDSLAYVLYTSGSTGQPKGVAIEHGSIVNYVQGILEHLEPAPGYHWALISTIAADLGNTVLFPALCTGGCLHILSAARAADPDALADYFTQNPIDVLKIVPSHLAALQSGDRPERVLPRRQLILGGESSPCHWVDRLHHLAPDCTILNHYGPTEATVGVATYRLPRSPLSGQRATVPLGRPLANTTLYILDQHLQPVPMGVPGELHVGGAGLARGYLNQDALTQAKFIANPFSSEPDARLYKTGDLARYLPDGNIEFLGRLDNQVKIRGFRIEPAEIEAALLTHAQVTEAVVIAQTSQAEVSRLIAYVVSALAPDRLSPELRSYLKQRLPDYMVPALFVSLAAMPLTPNGKVDRWALPVPAATDLATAAYVAPSSATEEALAAIWMQLLGLERVGVHDNFFELGGDSILGIQIIAQARQVGLKLTPKQLFENQTIAELATVATPVAQIQAEQGPVTGSAPLTPIQQRFWQQASPEPHHYNQSVLLSLPADIDGEKLRQALQQLIVHHDALRLRFERSATGWQQTHAAPETAFPLEVIDLTDILPGEQAAAIAQMSAQVQRRLDLAQGPLAKAVWFQRGPTQPGRLLIVIHHLVIDGVSWRILLADWVTAYQQLASDQPLQLPPKSTAFKTWAERLSTYAQSATVAAELDYWRQQTLADAPALPTDFPPAPQANTIAFTAGVTRALTAAQTQALLQTVPKAYNTQINDVLLTALVRSLMPWTQQSALLLELEGHGREDLFEDIDISRTVGWFTTLFPVRLQLNQATLPGEALKSVKEQLRQIPNRGLGYGLLRYLQADETVGQQLSRLPAPQVRFNYLGQLPQTAATGNWLERAPESAGSNRSPLGDRGYLLDILAVVEDQQLQVTWTYSKKIHQRSTVEQLVQRYMAQLVELIEHCLSPEAGGSTPSDFPEANLNQQELDELMAELENI
ncbi:amino acid adenylation domain-containing protein, partial [Sphaerothrix gracilis]|uniref:amino acid adenylation domain-containing protein n=1 Tax=Sphaerothrix gracilis TaxID=3151835 RepID=UPI0031FE0F26